MPLEELREMILEAHSKTQTNKIVAWVGNSQPRFDALVLLFLGDEYRVTQRAGWPLSHIAAEQPGLVKKHLKKIVGNLRKEGLHPAVKRNTVRLLQEIHIPQTLQGEVMEHCFRFIENVAEPVAVKAFSLTILHRLSKLYPEILPEIKTIVAAQIDRQTAAFKSRAKVFL